MFQRLTAALQAVLDDILNVFNTMLISLEFEQRLYRMFQVQY